MKRTFLSLATAHGCIYALGGLDNDTVLSSVERYDHKADVWYGVTPMIVPRSSAAVAVLKDQIFVIGGARDKNSSETSTVERFDGESWTKVLEMHR